MNRENCNQTRNNNNKKKNLSKSAFDSDKIHSSAKFVLSFYENLGWD